MNIRRLLKRIAVGFLCGVGIDYIIAIVVSAYLQLGYFMPCLAALPEIVGGEIRAVILQAVALGLPCAAVASLPCIDQSTIRKKAVKGGIMAGWLLVSLIPLGYLAAELMQLAV